MKILLPVDGSACSDRAVNAFIERRGWFCESPQIHLLHVHAPIPIGRVQEHIGHETLQRYYREEGELQLASAARQLAAAGLEWTPHIHVGQPAEVIAHQAGVLGCDLVFMGTHGHGAVTAAVLGSVAAKLLHLSPVPVLLVK
jgi:nucleotide-binding universal stress UspA family protein